MRKRKRTKARNNRPGIMAKPEVVGLSPEELIKSRRALFMTPQELRGEAAYTVLQLMIGRIVLSEVQRIEAAALLVAREIGNDPLTEEIEGLFNYVECEVPVH